MEGFLDSAAAREEIAFFFVRRVKPIRGAGRAVSAGFPADGIEGDELRPLQLEESVKFKGRSGR